MLSKKFNGLTLGLTITLASLSNSALADNFWEHNGSVMRLQAKGNQRVIRYEKPTARMRGAGARRGTILFDGVRQGNQYYGTARVFSKDCPTPLKYQVIGNVYNENTIVLTGSRMSISPGCQPNGRTRTDVLTFKLMR